MTRYLAVLALGLSALFCTAAAVAAADADDDGGVGRRFLGHATLTTNDSFGDIKDRWRTGSVAASLVWGPRWTGRAPLRFGRLIELRLGGQIISPTSLTTPAAADRPYAGALFAGLHSHFRRGATDFALGANLVVTGPQTGLHDLQDALHDLAGIAGPSPGVRAAQIGNGVHPTLVVEAGRDLPLGAAATLRPFVEARWGDETLLRAGADLTLGRVGRGELLIRDAVGGHRYRAIRQPFSGSALVLGADVAHVHDSIYLPRDRGYALTGARARLRLGLHHAGRRGSLFYGLTWLSEEFEAQPEGQLIGAIRLNLRF